MAKLTSCQLESYSSVTEWISAEDKIINDHAVCDIMIEYSWRKFYVISNLPNINEWQTFVSTFELTEKADTVASTVTCLMFFEAPLHRTCCLAPDATLFIPKKGRGRHLTGD